METKNGEPAILVEGLRKAFGKQTVLGGIDLRVTRGETLAVLGRSGTGKSVLLKLIVGLQKPDAGSIHIHGREVTNLALDELNEVRKKIGFLFQNAALYDSLSVEENVVFPLKRHTKMSTSEQRERARALLAQVGMEKDVQKIPAQLSGGMRKRVGLARAQVGNFLEKNSFGLVVVAAYTGATGEKDENLTLTQARAMVVRKYLVDKFKMDDTLIKTKGMGKDAQTEPSKANRVEIIVYPKEMQMVSK